MPDVKHHSRPFGVSEEELTKMEAFCASNQLDEIGRICAELRVLRAEYLKQSNIIGKQRAMVETLERNPNIRYSKELDSMISMTKEAKDAPAVP